MREFFFFTSIGNRQGCTSKRGFTVVYRYTERNQGLSNTFPEKTRKYCIRHNFRVQIFSRFWTRCGNSRGLNFAILLMLKSSSLLLSLGGSGIAESDQAGNAFTRFWHARFFENQTLSRGYDESLLPGGPQDSLQQAGILRTRRSPSILPTDYACSVKKVGSMISPGQEAVLYLEHRIS